MRASASVSNRMLDRPAAALRQGRGGGDAQTRVAGTLIELRTHRHRARPQPGRPDRRQEGAEVAARRRQDRSGTSHKYESAQTQLNAIIKSLASGQDELRKDNAAIETEKANMWTTMGKLSEYNELAAALDAAVEQKVAELEAAGKHRGRQHAEVRRAVPDPAAAAGHHDPDGGDGAGLHGPGPGPQEQPRADQGRRPGADHHHRRAAHRGHRVAGAVAAEARARPDHRAEHDHVEPDRVDVAAAADPGRGRSTSRRPRRTIDVAKLQAAFDNVFRPWTPSTPSAAQAVDSMAQTVQALEGQIERAKPYLERTRRGERQRLSSAGELAAGRCLRLATERTRMTWFRRRGGDDARPPPGAGRTGPHAGPDDPAALRRDRGELDPVHQPATPARLPGRGGGDRARGSPT